jgi:hypothetical protein
MARYPLLGFRHVKIGLQINPDVPGLNGDMVTTIRINGRISATFLLYVIAPKSLGLKFIIHEIRRLFLLKDTNVSAGTMPCSKRFLIYLGSYSILRSRDFIAMVYSFYIL